MPNRHFSPHAIAQVRKALANDSAGNVPATMTDLDLAVRMLDEFADLLSISAAHRDRPQAKPADLKFQLGQLRHLYAQMKAGLVTDTASAADGLLSPAIAAFEYVTTDDPQKAGEQRSDPEENDPERRPLSP